MKCPLQVSGGESIDGHFKGQVLLGSEKGHAMQKNTAHKPRRWERRPSAVPIRLIMEADPLKADDLAITIDNSPGGASIRTKLALALGDWVKIAAKGEFKQLIAALVVWVREDESDHSTLGLLAAAHLGHHTLKAALVAFGVMLLNPSSHSSSTSSPCLLTMAG
jgi:hypothetical protein